MKLSTSNTFDVSEVSGTKSYQDLIPFFDFVNTFTSDVVQAFNKQITFTDNLNYTTQSLRLRHGVGVNIGKVNPLFISLKCETSFLTYSLSTLSDSSKLLTVYFKATHNVQSSVALWQAGTIVRYEVRDASPFHAGDVVKMSSFGTANNNGTFLVTEVDLSNNYLYVNNRKRTSATGDELKTTFVGEDALTYSVTLGMINA